MLLLGWLALSSSAFNDGSWRCFEEGWAGNGTEFWKRAPVFAADRGEAPLFGVRDDRVGNEDAALQNALIIDQTSWDTHKLTSYLAAILLQERVGYKVALREHAVTRLSRMSANETAEPVHLNLEVWPQGRVDLNLTGVPQIGILGANGQDGIYTTTAFADAMASRNPPIDLDYWRALQHDQVVAALAYDSPMFNATLLSACSAAENGGAALGAGHCTTCNASVVAKWKCANGTFTSPLAADAAPNARGVLTMMEPGFAPGVVQQLVRNLNLSYELPFLGLEAAQRHVLAREAAGEPVLFYHWKPDSFHAENPGKFVRVTLPSYTSACADSGTGDPTGGIDCDWTYNPLLKYAAQMLETDKTDGPAMRFARHFQLAADDVDALLQRYVEQPPAAAGGPDRHFKAACAWAKEHHAKWSPWLLRPPPTPGACLIGDAEPAAPTSATGGICAWYFGAKGAKRGSISSCAPSEEAARLAIYAQALKDLFPTCTSCSNLWLGVLCAASYDPTQTSFVDGPVQVSYDDVATLAKPATLTLSAALAETLFMACRDEAPPGPQSTHDTVRGYFNDSVGFATWMGTGRLKLLRCQGRDASRSCLTAPLRVQVVADGGLSSSTLLRANPALKVYDYCRTAKNDPNYLPGFATALLVPVAGLWIGWILSTMASAAGWLWLTDSLIFALVGLGLGLLLESEGMATAAEKSSFDPGTVMFFLLPPIILSEGFTMDLAYADDKIISTTVFAIGGTLFCAAVVALVLIALEGHIGIPSISVDACWMFGSLIAAVDPVAIAQVYEALEVDNRLHALAGGESLLNDAAAIVLFRIALEFSDSGETPSVASAIVKLVRLGLGSIALGAAVGLFAAVMARCLPNATPTNSSNRLASIWLLLVYASYLIAEKMHFSGILSALCCACAMRLYAQYTIGNLIYEHMLANLLFLASQSTSLMFVFLGSACASFREHFSLPLFVTTIVLITGARAAFTVPLFALANRLLDKANRVPRSHIAMLCFTGLRGPIAVMLSMEVTSAERSMLISATCSIALFTVAVLGGLCPALIDWLGVLRGEDAYHASAHHDKAELEKADRELDTSKAHDAMLLCQKVTHGALFNLLVSAEGKREKAQDLKESAQHLRIRLMAASSSRRSTFQSQGSAVHAEGRMAGEMNPAAAAAKSQTKIVV